MIDCERLAKGAGEAFVVRFTPELPCMAWRTTVPELILTMCPNLDGFNLLLVDKSHVDVERGWAYGLQHPHCQRFRSTHLLLCREGQKNGVFDPSVLDFELLEELCLTDDLDRSTATPWRPPCPQAIDYGDLPVVQQHHFYHFQSISRFPSEYELESATKMVFSRLKGSARASLIEFAAVEYLRWDWVVESGQPRLTSSPTSPALPLEAARQEEPGPTHLARTSP